MAFLKIKLTKKIWLSFLGVFVCFFLGSIVVLSSRAEMIADDYRYLKDDVDVVAEIYNGDSGRITHAVISKVMYTVFGENTVNVFPVLLYLLFAVAIGYFLAAFVNRTGEALLYGAVGAALLMSAFVSLFDFAFFFSAAAIHAVTLCWAVFLAGFLIRSLRNLRPKMIGSLVMLLLTCMGGLLGELSIVLSGAIICAFMVAAVCQKKTGHIWFFISLLLCLVIAFSIIYMSPGSVARRAASSPGYSLLGVAKRAVFDYGSLAVSSFFSYRLVPVISLVILGVLFVKMNNIKVVRNLWLIGLGFLAVPLVLFFITNFSIGYSAMRIKNLAGFFMVGGMVVITIWRLARVRKPSIYGIGMTCGAFVVASTVVAHIFAIMPIYDAEVLRQEILQVRQEMIGDGRAAGEARSILVPAPLLLNHSEAIDLSFDLDPESLRPSDWLYWIVVSYYNLDGFNLAIKKQPKWYCIDEDVYNRFGDLMAKKCGTY